MIKIDLKSEPLAAKFFALRARKRPGPDPEPESIDVNRPKRLFFGATTPKITNKYTFYSFI